SLRNVVIKNRAPYEQGIHVFAQPVIGRSGNLDAYSLAVTGTTSLAFANGVPNNGDDWELYRTTSPKISAFPMRRGELPVGAGKFLKNGLILVGSGRVW